MTAEKLVLAATGVQAGNNLELKAEAPRLTLTADKASGEKLTVVAKVSGAKQTLVAQLALPGVEGTAQSFRTGLMSLDLDPLATDQRSSDKRLGASRASGTGAASW